MKITHQPTHYTFEINEGLKSNEFKIKKAPLNVFELAKSKVTFITTADNREETIENITLRAAHQLLTEFLSYYSKYQILQNGNTYQIILDQEEGFSIFIELVK